MIDNTRFESGLLAIIVALAFSIAIICLSGCTNQLANTGEDVSEPKETEQESDYGYLFLPSGNVGLILRETYGKDFAFSHCEQTSTNACEYYFEDENGIGCPVYLTIDTNFCELEGDELKTYLETHPDAHMINLSTEYKLTLWCNEECQDALAWTEQLQITSIEDLEAHVGTVEDIVEKWIAVQKVSDAASQIEGDWSFRDSSVIYVDFDMEFMSDAEEECRIRLQIDAFGHITCYATANGYTANDDTVASVIVYSGSFDASSILAALTSFCEVASDPGN